VVKPNVGIPGCRRPFKDNCLLCTTRVVGVASQRVRSRRCRRKPENVGALNPSKLIHIRSVVAHILVVLIVAVTHKASLIAILYIGIIALLTGVVKIEVVSNFVHLGGNPTTPFIIVDRNIIVEVSVGNGRFEVRNLVGHTVHEIAIVSVPGRVAQCCLQRCSYCCLRQCNGCTVGNRDLHGTIVLSSAGWT